MLKRLKPVNITPKLVMVLALYLALAVTYSVVTPIGRGADEWAHYWYVQFIAQHGRLPVNPAERTVAGYKSDWPPLYHLATAALTAWVDTAGPPEFKYRPDTPFGKDQIRRQLVPAQGPEAIVHTADELFPWRQEILVWHLGRLLSIGFGLGTLLVTYFVALEIFTSSKVASSKGAEAGNHYAIRNMPYTVPLLPPPILALLSVASLAFIPRFLFTGMVFGYDGLTLLLASLFLWLAIRVAKGCEVRWSYWGLGALAGLALLTKYLTALLPLEIIFLVFSRRTPTGRGGVWGQLGQALAAYVIVISGWVGYLLLNFNEIETYGPVLGTLAPFLRGDGSDRTVEQLFAWLSGGQAPAPAHLEQISYTSWQIVVSFFTTLWGNPITQPYPLTWFIIGMTTIALLAFLAIVSHYRPFQPSNTLPGTGLPPFHPSILPLLFLHCLLSLPFMLIRLFGARDVLEAVQGRHLLFLSGPALAVLLIWGVARGVQWVLPAKRQVHYFVCTMLLGFLLAAAIGQLIYMAQIYAKPAPVRTTAYVAALGANLAPNITLPGGAKLLDFTVTPVSQGDWLTRLFNPGVASVLQVVLTWQGGPEPAPDDYKLELALVDMQGRFRANWLAYQTQAAYPTRAWEAGDIVRDEGWLPVGGLEMGDYELRLRILDETQPMINWQTLTTYSVPGTIEAPNQPEWTLWRNGIIHPTAPLFSERETAQLTFTNPQSPITNLQLIGPDNIPHPPASAGSAWVNFIIEPDWPPGDYRLHPNGEVLFRVAPGRRNFQPPTIAHPLEVNFESQIQLLGYDLPTRRVKTGDSLPITLYWQALQWLGEDFVIFVRLLDNEQHSVWGGYDRLAKENYSTLFWAPGEFISDGFAVPVAADAPPGVYVLNLGWYRRVNGQAESLTIVDPATGQPTATTSVTIGPIKVDGPPPGVTLSEPKPQVKLNQNLGDQIALLGYDLDQLSFEACQTEKKLCHGRITLYWQALSQPLLDYTVFTHLRSVAGGIVAQQDSPPAGGVYPTGLWDSGEIIQDKLQLPLAKLPPGHYELVVGMYDPATGNRLAVTGSPDNALVLRSFEVTE